MDALTEPIVFERGEKLYLVGPVGVHKPTEKEIEEYAFSKQLRAQAPNPHIVWMRGQYVEADIANLNKVMWTAQELQIKQLTPMFMPVTVMHDPRTAVGVIADTKLLTPEADGVPRSKIETSLALWSHRFPEAVEEALDNAEKGTLMQSMECFSPDYSCSVCGLSFQKLPGGAERLSWCAHLKGENADDQSGNASRILGNVVFTGTGLIYGTWGAEGADPKAHLEVFQEEVAQLHKSWHEAAAHEKTSPKPSPRRKRNMEIEDREYQELIAAKTRKEALESEIATANKAVEDAEAAQKKAEDERDSEKQAREQAEEKARRVELRDERWGKLGAGFTAKLGEKTSERLRTQAGEMSDEDWQARLEELSEAYGVKPDAEAEETAGGKKPGEKDREGKADEGAEEEDEEFSVEEVARAGFGGAREPEGSDAPSAADRAGVMAGLSSKPAAKKD